VEDTSITYKANETIDNENYWYYTINNPEVGNWTFKVRAIDVPQEGENITFTCVDRTAVSTIDRPPTIAQSPASPDTTKNGVAKTVTYTTGDPDGDAVNFGAAPYYNVDKPIAGTAVLNPATGILTFTPDYADIANSPFTFTVTAHSGSPELTASVTTVFAVIYARKRGDVNGNGVDPGDATSVLRICVGLDPEPEPGTDAFYGSDANADGTISPIDASWVLYYLVNDEYPNHTVPKISGTGAVSFAKATTTTDENKDQVIDLPLVLTKSSGIVSAFVNVNIDNSVADVKYVNAKLPEGSSMLYNYKNSILKIAIAGIHELANGTMVNIGIILKNKEVKLDVNGFAQLNDNEEIALENTSIREIPFLYALQNNYPNPFNPTTTVQYQIPENTQVRLVVYDMLGQIVRTIVDEAQEAGYYSVEWDGRNNNGESVSSGVYIYRIQVGSFVTSKKMNFIK
jgi:hypothetical protein